MTELLSNCRSEGKGCEKDIELSYDYFVKGCQFGHAKSCMNAGLLDVTDGWKRMRPRNPKMGAEFLKKVSSTY